VTRVALQWSSVRRTRVNWCVVNQSVVHSCTARRLAALLIFLLLSGCGGSSRGGRTDLAPPGEMTSLGPGDLFQLEIVGEPDLPKEYQVAADGTVTLPYIHTVKVEGLEPQQLAAEVRQKLMDQKILTDPSVVVTVKEYRSKVVTLLGQVQRPGSFALAPGMTLIHAVSLAGGFTSIAQTTAVNVARTTADKTTKTVVVNVEDIYEGRSQDIPLQPGDRIYVPERVF